MIPSDDPTSLSRLYHLNSEPWLNDAAYRAGPYLQEFKEHRDAPRIPLPPPADPGTVLRLSAQRRSIRAFKPEPIGIERLARVVHATYGVVEVATLDPGPAPGTAGPLGRFLRRSVPSAGGLYPLELYLMLRRIDGAPEGIHHFDARGDALELVRPGAWQEEAAEVFYTWPYVAEANAIVCIAAVFNRCQKKYGPRGYRYVLLEAGHAAQNLCLAAQEEHLGTLCMGGCRDGAIDRLLGLAEPAEGVVYAVAVGVPA